MFLFHVILDEMLTLSCGNPFPSAEGQRKFL